MVSTRVAALPPSRAALRGALETTASWAARALRTGGPETRRCSASCRAAPRPTCAESAQRTVELDFDGYPVGGLSVGETCEEMLPALDAALEHLPSTSPAT